MMATVMQAKSIMINSTVFKVFLMLYLVHVTRGLATIEYRHNFTSPSLECVNNSLYITKDYNSYTLEFNPNSNWSITEQFVKCDQECHYSIRLDTACNNLGVNGYCNDSCVAGTTQCQSPSLNATMIALIAAVVILAMLLGLVIICWIGTYKTMKKRIRALQSTLVTSNTGNSLTIDTNNREPNREPHNQLLCFQNKSYEQNSPSFSQSPAPECPETNIYDLPFQVPAGVNKEKPKSQLEPLPKGSIRYKAQTLPKGSIRYTANTPKSGEESKNECKSAPESPRMNEIEFLCSGKEQQWAAVTEYEVPITQQDTQN